MILLTDRYALAFLGHEPLTGRAVYSLPMLAHVEEQRKGLTPESAREVMMDMVNQFTEEHGDKAPVFVDDTISRIEAEPENLIVLPTGPNIRS